MRPWAVWAIGASLVVAAWGVTQITPPENAAVTPFVVPAEVGGAAVARSFEITVTDPRRGDRAVAGGWAADGTWIVVDVDVEARVDEVAALLGHAVLVVDGVTYRASERPASIFGTPLAVGIPRSGSLAFELPADAARGTATLELALSDETRLDSVVHVPIDLDALPRQPEVALARTGWATP